MGVWSFVNIFGAKISAMRLVASAIYFALFMVLLLLVAIMPWWLLYRFSDLAAFVLRRVMRYRLDVIRSNLRCAFPNSNTTTLRQMEAEAYRNLADIAVETLKGFTMTNRSIQRRHRVLNPEKLDRFFEQGQSVIGLTAHLNNWEWGAMSAATQLRHTPIAFYTPLSNRLIDRVIKRHRSLRGTVIEPTTNTHSTFERNKNRPCIYLLVADQSPSNLERAIWLNFLGQDTPCIHGPEKYATLYNYPVVYIDIVRKRRGFYEIELQELCEQPKALAPHELTHLYMNRVEQAIHQSPSSWLWTHRRWKRRREELQTTTIC